MKLRSCKSKHMVARGMSMAVLAGAGTLLGARPAFAVDNGPTTQPAACMQEVFTSEVGGGTLNCTANDVRISSATSVSPATCVAGTEFNLEATFQTVVTANSRYDVGFWFNTEGGDSARGDGSTDECSLSALEPPPPPNGSVLDLDGDACGDLNSGTYSFTFTLQNVLCEAAQGTNLLRLPNCTSWHNKAGTVCDPNTDEFEFFPDTKSKCVCDDNFTVPVVVVPASLLVVKRVTPTEFVEPGGIATYTVEITNGSNTAPVTIDSIDDDPYGDLLDPANTDVTDNTCLALDGEPLGPGATASCTFKALVDGDPGDVVTDTVEACVTQVGVPNPICNSASASVTITDEFVPPTLLKSVQSCTMDVTYQVVVQNNSTKDTLTVNTLSDDRFGNITAPHGPSPGIEQVVSTDCTVPRNVAVSGSTTCSFVGRIPSDTCSFSHTNTVTGGVTDSDNVPSTPSDSATITVTKQ
ncbi:hypothetical protein SAMN02745121_01817 [Nannocystis exedens]|uniref:Uncharacterized protein n=1 Tax=Nannocystis exedens TaxID=54 RepID=A0A1I1VP58_9BACT|nr:hypothetical protein [Nannocystis exedens]PCC72701.1 hypothetical protein NAEX_05785 [Nannocystis exedens]SFD84604.1 hypothetical protein SAMN02745121_01817 [Nannocystis exedens]